MFLNIIRSDKLLGRRKVHVHRQQHY